MKPSTKKLKIGIVFDDSLDRNDGVQQYIKTLENWLRGQGHDVHFLVGSSQQVQGKTIHSLARNIAVSFNKNKLSIPLPGDSKAIRKLLADQNYDVLHVQMPYSPTLAGKIISNIPTSCALVGTFHILPYGQLQTFGSRLLAAINAKQLERFNAICSVSPAAASFAKKYFKISSEIIPNMIDVKKFKSRVKVCPGRIVFLGRLVPRKGCLELIKAIAWLSKHFDHKNLEVIIAGSGPEESKLKKYCLNAELNFVKFIGYIAEDQKADLLGSAEIGVFPASGGESFGIVLLEAMASGAEAVIGGDNDGYKSVLGTMPMTLFNPNNTEKFAKLIHNLLTDKKFTSDIHVHQQNLVQGYDVNIVGPNIERMYRRAILQRF